MQELRELGAILVAVAAVAMVGSCLVRGLLGAPSGRTERCLHRWIAVAVGLGAFAVSHAVYLFVFGGYADGWILKDGALALLGFGGWRSCGGGKLRGGETLPPVAEESSVRWLRLAVWCAAILGVVFFVLRARISPDGQWDAWMIWNLRARFLMVEGPGWADGFSPLLHKSHPDYPFLLPSLVAQGWRLCGASVGVPLALGGLFAALAVGILGSAVSALRGGQSGWTAALVLLGTPCLVTRSANQLADLPLAVFMLAAAALVLSVLEGRTRAPGGLALAGVLASCAAWTKNEGLLHFLVMGVVVTAVGPGVGWQRLRRAGWFALGALPVLGLLLAFKVLYAPVNDLVGNTSAASAWARLLDVDRYLTILRAYGQALLSVDKWGGMGLLGLALWSLFRPRFRGRAVEPLCLGLALCGVGFTLVYLLTPWDLHWHLATSLHRILLQCWPLALLTLFVALPPIPVLTPRRRQAG